MLNLRGVNQAGRPLLILPLLELDVERTKELGVTFALSPATMMQTPRPSKLLAVRGPIPLKPPGPKSLRNQLP